MSFFVPQTKDLDIGGSNIVTVRLLTMQEHTDISDSIRRMSREGYGTDDDYEMAQLEHSIIITLEKSITTWSGPGFTDEDGKDVPYSPKAFRQLPKPVVQDMLKELGDWLSIGDAEKKVSNEPSSST